MLSVHFLVLNLMYSVYQCRCSVSCTYTCTLFFQPGIELTEVGWEILDLLSENQRLVRASRRTMALAGAFACPSVFRRLIECGGDVNHSLDHNETTMHVILQRNSVEKVQLAIDL